MNKPHKKEEFSSLSDPCTSFRVFEGSEHEECFIVSNEQFTKETIVIFQVKCSPMNPINFFIGSCDCTTAFGLEKFDIPFHLFLFHQEEKVLRQNKKFQTIETRKDGVRFTNSSLREMSSEYLALKATYTSVQSQLASEVIKIAGNYLRSFEKLGSI